MKWKEQWLHSFHKKKSLSAHIKSLSFISLALFTLHLCPTESQRF